MKIPTDHRILQLGAAVSRKYSSLADCYSVCHGLKLYLQKSGNNAITTAGNIMTSIEHYVTNSFVFSIDGMIIACLLNATGSFHDSSLAYWGNADGKLDAMSMHGDETKGGAVLFHIEKVLKSETEI